MPIIKTDVIIIGAGAAGLMCAIEAGLRHRKVIVLDHANKPGKKILMSGGGRCNFTNLTVSHENFISHNAHFCKSALHRYTPADFIALVKKHRIAFHEKAHGQLFCDNKASDIVQMLLSECAKNHVEILLNTEIKSISKGPFRLETNRGTFECESLVVATGGLSIPTMGASPFGYKIAEQFDINVYPTRAGLVPLTLHTSDKEKFTPLAGVSLECSVKSPHKTFQENMLFTHRGLSGPAVLQISSYWQPGELLHFNLLPGINLIEVFKQKSDKYLNNVLCEYLPKRCVEVLFDFPIDKPIKAFSPKVLTQIAEKLHHYDIKPNGTEGYRTAEVTLGGVNCDAISSKTMEANDIPGLYFIGEVLDVTGWLGGYNFQWAWASGWAAGQCV